MYLLLYCFKISTKHKGKEHLFLFFTLYMCIAKCPNLTKALTMSLLKVFDNDPVSDGMYE